MRADTVEQLFVRRRGGRAEVLMVLESPAGERQRETLPAPSASFEAAVRLAAVHLARRGVAAAARLRLRVEREGTLSDDPALREIFLAALAREETEEPWD